MPLVFSKPQTDEWRLQEELRSLISSLGRHAAASEIEAVGCGSVRDGRMERRLCPQDVTPCGGRKAARRQSATEPPLHLQLSHYQTVTLFPVFEIVPSESPVYAGPGWISALSMVAIEIRLLPIAETPSSSYVPRFPLTVDR